jgi:hypothetical protein
VHEKHCSSCTACLVLFEYRVPHGKWNLSLFDVSSKEHDLIVVRFSLIKFRLYLKAELDLDESRQVILLIRLLLEILPTLPLVSPYVALGPKVAGDPFKVGIYTLSDSRSGSASAKLAGSLGIGSSQLNQSAATRKLNSIA